MYLATKIKMVRELMVIESESKAFIFHCFVKVKVMMIKFTSQSVEFDRARDIDLSEHASHPKTIPRCNKKRAVEEKGLVGKTGREWRDLISY